MATNPQFEKEKENAKERRRQLEKLQKDVIILQEEENKEKNP